MLALVDDENHEYLSNYNWAYSNERYAVTNHSGKFTSMHQLVVSLSKMDIPSGFIIDHRDGNGLNNQKINLRICTQSHNQMNKSKTTSKTTSQYKGVHFDKYCGKWNPTIEKTIEGKRKKYNLGLFDNEYLAARVYDVNALYWFKEYAKTNFPTEDYQDEKYDKYIVIDKPIKRTSKYKYVCWQKSISKWAVELTHNKQRYKLGFYEDEVEAAKKANEFIIENKLNKYLNEV